MSFVVEAVEDVGDAFGDVIEGVGDIVEDIGDVLSDAGDWIGENIIEPILDDPITFIISAAAYAYGIPGLTFAGPGTAASVSIATTGSRLAQGDDFDDAVRAGAMAGLTTGVTNSIAKGISTGGQDWSPNLYSTADELAANALKSSTSSAASRASQPSIDLINEGQLASSSVDDKLLSEALSSSDDQLLRDLADADSLAKVDYPEYELLASADGGQLVPKTTADPIPDAAIDVLNDVPASNANRPPQYQQVASDVTPDPRQTAFGKDYKSSIDVPDPAASSPPTNIKDPRIPKDAIIVEVGPGDPGYVPPIETRPSTGKPVIRVDSAGNILPDAPSTGWQSAKNLAGAVAERSGSWVWDGVQWVWDDPLRAVGYGAAGVALAGGLGNDDDTPEGDKESGKDENQKRADEYFYSDLSDLELKRVRQPIGFDRSQNPYGPGGLYSYGEQGPEFSFYGPTTYQPVEYSQSVMAAQGGSIGALNSQLPSYYRYGAMPMAMGGYASGGLKSLAHDGRSDHIPAMLSDGEYVIDAETVALLGNGSNEAGANRLEGMRQEVRKQKGKALAKGKFSSNAKSPLSYIKQRRG